MRLLAIISLIATTAPASAAVFDLTIDGPDAIFLAGRTDVVIPAADQPWPGGMIRHGGPTPEEALEQLPTGISVVAGNVIKVLDTAVGCINYFNGFDSQNCFGPEGNGPLTASNLGSFGGISGYLGSQGALVGVFLDDEIPTGPAPSAIDFGTLGAEFASLSPELGQVFFIGNGKTSGGDFQSFIAPTGATRLFFGIPDGFGFVGAPGAYDDNDGSYRIRVGIDEEPGPSEVPLPATGLLLLAGLGGLGALRARRR